MLLPILGTLSLLGAVYFLMPLAIGVHHIGMFWPAALLLLAAEFAQRQERDTPAQLFRYLTGLARQVWQVRCFVGPAAVRCARVLAAGYAQLSQA